MSSVIWQAVLGEIEVMVSKASFSTWFKNTLLLKNEAGSLTIGVPNIFTKRQFETKFNTLIKRVLKKNGVKVESISYKIYARQLADAPKPNLTAPIISSSPLDSSNLNGRYSFDNFVVGSSNELAHAAAQAIIREPGTKYNPFFIYGGVGLGKTHLIQAIGNEILHRRGGRIKYVTSERFKNEFIAGILRNNSQSLTNKYRNVDVLIVDDMQFMSGKEKTQEEFFHTFNNLYQNNKQIIISSDKSPQAMSMLEERLRSRFEWGMTADIQPPDLETRIAIIKTKAARTGARLSNDIAEYLATHIQANIRELEGALTRLLAHCEMRKTEPTLEMVEHMIQPSSPQNKPVSPDKIVDSTARFFNLSTAVLTGPKRDREIVQPRQIAMYLIRTELHLSFPQVARLLGRNDHTTAIHSVGKIEQELSSNHYLRQKVLALKEKIYV